MYIAFFLFNSQQKISENAKIELWRINKVLLKIMKMIYSVTKMTGQEEELLN